MIHCSWNGCIALLLEQVIPEKPTLAKRFIVRAIANCSVTIEVYEPCRFLFQKEFSNEKKHRRFRKEARKSRVVSSLLRHTVPRLFLYV